MRSKNQKNWDQGLLFIYFFFLEGGRGCVKYSPVSERFIDETININAWVLQFASSSQWMSLLRGACFWVDIRAIDRSDLFSEKLHLVRDWSQKLAQSRFKLDAFLSKGTTSHENPMLIVPFTINASNFPIVDVLCPSSFNFLHAGKGIINIFSRFKKNC